MAITARKQIKEYVSKGLACFLISTVIFFNYGCGSKRQALSIETHLDLYARKIALVPALEPIKSSLNVPAKGWKEGFVFGAGQAAVDTTKFFVEGGSCEGEICAFMVLVYLSALVTGVTIGSVYEAMASPSAESVKAMEKGLIDKMGTALSQHTFAELVEKNASENPEIDIEMVVLEGEMSGLNTQGFDVLKARGFQQAIIVKLSNIEFIAEKGQNPPLTMSMIAVVDIIKLNQPEEKTSRTYRYLGQKANYNEWMTKDGIELNKDFDLGLQSLAESIYHDIFISFDLPMSSGDWDFPGSGNLFGCCWICPDTPPLDYSFWGRHLRYPQVESLHPTLIWTVFPDKRQAKQFFDATGKTIDEVMYDLKIWQENEENIFQVNNIPENYHTLESDLSPQTNFFWSIRACFEMGNKSICTPWSKSTIPATSTPTATGGHVPFCEQPASIHNHFRFRTP